METANCFLSHHNVLYDRHQSRPHLSATRTANAAVPSSTPAPPRPASPSPPPPSHAPGAAKAVTNLSTTALTSFSPTRGTGGRVMTSLRPRAAKPTVAIAAGDSCHGVADALCRHEDGDEEEEQEEEGVPSPPHTSSAAENSAKRGATKGSIGAPLWLPEKSTCPITSRND